MKGLSQGGRWPRKLGLLAALTTLGLVSAAAPAMAAKPQIQLEQSSYNTPEGGQTVLRAVANAKVTGPVQITLTNGTATASGGCPTPASNTGSDDYAKIQSPLTVQFNNSKTSTGATSDTCDDNVNEPNETYKATITSVPGGDQVGGKKQATITIVDNDPMTLSLNSIAVNEGDPAGLTVSTNGVTSTSPHTVSFTTADGAPGVGVAGDDYTPKSGTVTIPAGATSAPLPNITTLADGAWSPTEFFNVNITGVTGPNASAGSNGQVTLNELSPKPYFTIDDATAWEGNNVVFTVTKHGSSEVNNGLSFATASAGAPPGHATGGTACGPGVDYVSQGSPPPLIFGPGGDATQQISVATCPDTDVEPNETFNLATTGTVNADPPGSAATGTIKDDEPASLVLSGAGTGNDNLPVPVVATVSNTSGDPLPGLQVRFELFRDIGTPDGFYEAIDGGQNGGARFATTDALGNATITDSGPAAGNATDKYAACLDPAASTNAAVCTAVNDPSVPSSGDPLNPSKSDLYDGNEDVTVNGLRPGVTGDTHTILFTP